MSSRGRGCLRATEPAPSSTRRHCSSTASRIGTEQRDRGMKLVVSCAERPRRVLRLRERPAQTTPGNTTSRGRRLRRARARPTRNWQAPLALGAQARRTEDHTLDTSAQDSDRPRQTGPEVFAVPIVLGEQPGGREERQQEREHERRNPGADDKSAVAAPCVTAPPASAPPPAGARPRPGRATPCRVLPGSSPSPRRPHRRAGGAPPDRARPSPSPPEWSRPPQAESWPARRSRSSRTAPYWGGPARAPSAFRAAARGASATASRARAARRRAHGQRGRDLIAAELDAAGEQLLHQRRGAAERHMVHLDAGVALQVSAERCITLPGPVVP